MTLHVWTVNSPTPVKHQALYILTLHKIVRIRVITMLNFLNTMFTYVLYKIIQEVSAGYVYVHTSSGLSSKMNT